MQADLSSFGVLEIDGRRYEHDVVIERGLVRKRKKAPSRPYQEVYGHTPLSIDEDIPWDVSLLLVGSGAAGRLPVMPEVWAEAERRGVDLVVEPTDDVCRRLGSLDLDRVGIILHVTC